MHFFFHLPISFIYLFFNIKFPLFICIYFYSFSSSLLLYCLKEFFHVLHNWIFNYHYIIYICLLFGVGYIILFKFFLYAFLFYRKIIYYLLRFRKNNGMKSWSFDELWIKLIFQVYFFFKQSLIQFTHSFYSHFEKYKIPLLYLINILHNEYWQLIQKIYLSKNLLIKIFFMIFYIIQKLQ